MTTNYFTYAVPVFIGAMIVEAGLAWRKGKPTYTWSDTFANIGSGMGSQLAGLFLATLTAAVYDGVYRHRLVDLAEGGWAAWVLALVGVDFCYYWYHRLSHEVSLFWATHVVHHQSEEYNLSVALRQSWFAGIYSWIFYVPLALLGVPLSLFALSYSLNLLYQFIIHTRTVKTLGPLERVLNTPSHHRVHHGSNLAYLDKNYAGVLIIWDRLFGTFTPESEPVEYGLVKPLRSFNPVWANLQAWVELARAARPLPGWAKLKIWIKNPGWLPGDRSSAAAQARAAGRVYQKHVLPAPWVAISYVFLSFLVIMAGTVAVMALGPAMPAAGLSFVIAGAVSSMALWQGLLSLERRAVQVEGARLALMAAATVALAAAMPVPAWVLAGLAAYLAASVAVWTRLRQRSGAPSAGAPPGAGAAGASGHRSVV